MNPERFEQRKSDFLKAVCRLEEACAQPENGFIRDSVIQRFEFSWELAWKVLKLRLSYLGVEALNPREVIRQSVQMGVIKDGNAWTEAQRQRLAVYAFIQHQGCPLLRELADSVAQWGE